MEIFMEFMQLLECRPYLHTSILYELTSKVGISLVAAYFSPFNIAKEAMYVFCEPPLKAQILVLLENL